MRIHNYPTDVLTGTEQFLASNFNTVTQEYETVNFTVDTLKTFLTTDTNNGVTSIVFEGAANDDHDGTLTSVAASSSKTYTLPNATGFVALYSVDPAGVTITSTPAELNTLDGYLGSVTELNYLKDLYDTGVTAAEYDYLDITTLGTSQNSKVVTAGAGGIVKLTGELQVSYASPRIFFEDTGSNRADTLVHQLNDLFRIDTRANGGSFVTALDIDASLANPTVTIHKKLTMASGANIQSANDISAGQFKVPNLNSAPASASASGTQGDIVFANDAIYVCVATNTWKKAALSTF
tara:strand:+ start:91 stop:972 length:882 start_codon:yes stop_codon:yes gene_type:complete